MNVYTQAVRGQKREAHSRRWCSARKENEMNRLDIYGHGQSGNVRKVSWLMVGAIGFEPMTSTV